MLSICGLDCCSQCNKKESCGGCLETSGHPFGGTCVAAECVKRGGTDELLRIKNMLIDEINSLGIEHLQVNGLNLLNGFYVNLEYPLANGQSVKLLKDNRVYFGTQLEIPGTGRCYGLVADEAYLLVCEYGANGENPQIILYKKR